MRVVVLFDEERECTCARALDVREKRMRDEHFLKVTKKRTFLFPHEKDFTCDLKKYSPYHAFTTFKRARRRAKNNETKESASEKSGGEREDGFEGVDG